MIVPFRVSRPTRARGLKQHVVDQRGTPAERKCYPTGLRAWLRFRQTGVPAPAAPARTGALSGPWPIILVATSILGGISLLGIGLLGEHIAPVYDEVNCRTVYGVDRVDVGKQGAKSRDLCYTIPW